MNFNLEESKIYQSLSFQKGPIFFIAKIGMQFIFIILAFLVFAIYWFNDPIYWILMAIVLLSLMPLSYFRLAFIDDKPDQAIANWRQNSEKANIVQAMGPTAIKVMMAGEKMARTNHQKLNPHWLLSGFFGELEGQILMMRLGVVVKDEMPLSTTELPLADVFMAAVDAAEKSNGQFIEAEDLLIGLAKFEPSFQGLLSAHNLDETAVFEVANWHKRVRKEYQKIPFWRQPIVGGVGQDWAYGYTTLLSRFAINLTKVASASGRHIEIFSKSSLVEEVERILARSSHNNVLLVGEPGVGKKTIAYALARKILDGKIHPALRYKQIMQVNVGSILAGSGGKGEIVGRIEGLMQETARAGNIILFFDDINALVSPAESEGTINATEIFLPYLEGDRIQVIGTTTIEDFHRDIETSKGIASAFERIDVPEPSSEEALKVLEETVPFLEGHYSVIFPISTLKEIINLSERYLHDKPFPQKALDLADEAAVKVSGMRQLVVTPQDIQDIISSRSHVPVGEVQETEKGKLLQLEAILHERVIGQDEAIKAVADALRRARSGLGSKNRPIGSFLFIGPTGVGKTETAKALAEVYYGSEEKMLRFDMSEYQEASSVYRLIGAPPVPGKESEPGLLTTAIHDNPFSLVLLDELEKAHPNILTLFLQVFDDGRLTSASGDTVNFSNAIIIATSNAGSEVIREYLQAGQQDSEKLKQMLLDYLQKQGIYRPEFLNRFDAVICFKPLTVEEIQKVAGLMIDGVNRQLAEKGISLQLAPEAMEYLISKGYDPVFGARPMRRVIQDKVENALAKRMLSEKIARGTVITLSVKDFEG